jgi:hypothetical protein
MKRSSYTIHQKYPPPTFAQISTVYKILVQGGRPDYIGALVGMRGSELQTIIAECRAGNQGQSTQRASPIAKVVLGIVGLCG